MLRSMFTAISSLLLNQSYIDVVADNLANANTIGFKASRFSFLDQFTQIESRGSPPTNDIGGVSPIQIGLGTRIGTITPSFTQGALQNTSRNTDLAIQGDGFLIYSNGEAIFHSRDGMLDMDANGYLVHSPTGFRIQGWMAVDGVIDTDDPITGIQLPMGATQAQATANVVMGGNLDATLADGSTFTTTFGVYDSLGGLHSITVTFTHEDPVGTDPLVWTWYATGDTSVSGVTPAVGSKETLVFDSDGQFVSNTDTEITATVLTPDGAAALSFDLDLTDLSQLATDGDVDVFTQDGLAAGSLTTFFVAQDTAEIYALYSNGLQEVVGQLAMSKFLNPSGLVRAGQNMYIEGVNSGVAAIGIPSTGGRGNITTGYLEASNVDMATEFTNMILAQRGFQASSRVITTSDEMLAELVNLKR